MQPGRGRTDRHGFDPAAQEVNEGALEALRLGAGGDPAGAQAVDDLGDFGLAQIGHRERQEIVPGNASFASIERSEFRRAGPPCGLRSNSSIAPVRPNRHLDVVDHPISLSRPLPRSRREFRPVSRSAPPVSSGRGG